jgi:hypothetical protein
VPLADVWVGQRMIPTQISGLATVSAEALLRLELLLGERVVTLSAISDIVSQDGGLKIHVLQLAHDTASDDGDQASIDECIVEIGIERLRESLRQTRFRLKAN